MTVWRVRAATATAAACLSLLLAGCGGAEKAVTVTPASTSADSSSTTGSASPEPALSTAPAVFKPLTKAQLAKALPPASVLGNRWKVTKQSSSDDSNDKVSPASCQKVFDSLEKFSVAKPVAEVKRDYTKSSFGPFATVSLESYAEPVSSDQFDAIAAALSKCPTFKSKTKSGTVTYTADALDFPNVGDQTLAFELGVDTDVFPFTAEFAVTRIGSTTVSVATIALGGSVPEGQTLKLMRATLDRLPK